MGRSLGPMMLAVAVLFSPVAQAQPLAGADNPQEGLAAQIRLQGFACDKPLEAVRDKKRSRPDYAVWTLKCSNGTYRIGRAPDMAAKVESVR
ncbi:hypothetical protein FXB41_36545 [Bradyrhizobium canariense]|nr:hypothetical protein [Bradyrhizobium canariense]